MDSSYKALREIGLEVYRPLAAQCLESYSNGITSDVNTSFLIVLCIPNTQNKAYIVMTEQTAAASPQLVLNLENRLDKQFKFVTIERIISDKNSVESFLQDAKELKPEKHGTSDSGDSPSYTKFKAIISDAVKSRASDIHYYVGANAAKFVFRIDGALNYENRMNVTEAREMMSAALNNAGKGLTGFEDDTKPFDLPIEVKVEVMNGGQVSYEDVTLRLSRRGNKGYEGYKAVMRVNVKSNQSVSLDSCNYPVEQENVLRRVLNAPYGIFLATGPVGSGKSTTSSAMLEMFDPERGGLTVEDPIEFDIQHPHIYQYQVNENAVEMTLSKLLKNALRQDPDLINVAEIRDKDVAKQVFEYSRVGTVMMSTLHTNEAIYTLPRLLDLGIPLNELSASDTFLGILNQRLLRKICVSCSIALPLEAVGTVYTHNPKGCDNCKAGRLPGRITVSELLVPNSSDADYIMNQDWNNWRNDLIKRGFKTLALRALELSKESRICWTDVLKKIPHASVVNEHFDLFPVKVET